MTDLAVFTPTDLDSTQDLCSESLPCSESLACSDILGQGFEPFTPSAI